jgi:hypothetical protein
MSVIGHCLAIFWPRKPLKTPRDENGFPILWCNNSEEQKDIACVWQSASEDPAEAFAEPLGERRSA